MKDLFGNEMRKPVPAAGKRRATKAKGYAAPPGSGPASETCKSCRHLARITYSKTYLKCRLIQTFWTRGPGTDVRAAAPACRLWERKLT
jgi:hypothetical protein